VLVGEERTRLGTRFRALGGMLNDVHNQAVEFFQRHLEKSSTREQSLGFLDAADFDLLFTPPRAIPDDLTEIERQNRRLLNEQQLRAKRSKLAQAFLPFLQQKLTSQLVVETLATSLNADPVLIEMLLTKADLLTDSQPRRPLLDAFASAGERGISVEFFNGASASLGKQTAATADTTGRPVPANRARFEGYFEVPTAGAYRFFAVLGTLNAEAELRIGDLPDPVIRCRATSDGEEFSQFIELKAGVPYRFAFDARPLGDGDVELLVQGQNLPKGPLSQLTLYPQSTVERVGRARVLLAKTLQLIYGLGLSERDVRHVLTHRADFDDIDRVYRRRLSAGQISRRGRRDAPGYGHRGVLWDDRRYAFRPVPHPRVLRGADETRFQAQTRAHFGTQRRCARCRWGASSTSSPRRIRAAAPSSPSTT